MSTISNISEFGESFARNIDEHIITFKFVESHENEIDEVFEAFVAYIHAASNASTIIAEQPRVAQFILDNPFP